MTRTAPFTQHVGSGLPNVIIDGEVPDSVRNGLINVLASLVEKGYVRDWGELATASLYAGRRLKEEFSNYGDRDVCIAIIREMEWHRFIIFCERVYSILQGQHKWDGHSYIQIGSIEDSQDYFTRAVNALLDEERLAYEFKDGVFHRLGRPLTQESLQRVGTLLADPRYDQVRKHYKKAIDFFQERPEPDVQNCIKESICALEAFVDIVLGDQAGEDFDRVIRSKRGTSKKEMAATIGESIIKLRAFRGDARGVAHAALGGAEVDTPEAELALNLVASYVTYLHDKYAVKEEEIPF